LRSGARVEPRPLLFAQVGLYRAWIDEQLAANGLGALPPAPSAALDVAAAEGPSSDGSGLGQLPPSSPPSPPSVEAAQGPTEVAAAAAGQPHAYGFGGYGGYGGQGGGVVMVGPPHTVGG
jgi:hypothetical protein